MKKTYLIIAALFALLAWREYTRAESIAWAIQDTSDGLLVACETKIDELNAVKATDLCASMGIKTFTIE